MARKQTKKEETFIEFNFNGTEFNYTGRLYPEFQKETQKCTITPLSLTLNGVITIKGCRLFQSDKNSWITGPSYYKEGKRKNDGEYVSYLYIDEKLNKEVNSLVSELEKLLDN